MRPVSHSGLVSVAHKSVHTPGSEGASLATEHFSAFNLKCFRKDRSSGIRRAVLLKVHEEIGITKYQRDAN